MRAVVFPSFATLFCISSFRTFDSSSFFFFFSACSGIRKQEWKFITGGKLYEIKAADPYTAEDIDYNQKKYLIETRISGALIKPYSAIAIETAKASSVTGTEDNTEG